VEDRFKASPERKLRGYGPARNCAGERGGVSPPVFQRRGQRLEGGGWRAWPWSGFPTCSCVVRHWERNFCADEQVWKNSRNLDGSVVGRGEQVWREQSPFLDSARESRRAGTRQAAPALKPFGLFDVTNRDRASTAVRSQAEPGNERLAGGEICAQMIKYGKARGICVI
jgi:hypothetical protein